MKYQILYIKFINFIQKLLLYSSITIFLFIMPILFVFNKENFSQELYTSLFNISLIAVTFVMAIRPLADITACKSIRSLVILRKGMGVLSASIIVGFMIGKFIEQGATYIKLFFDASYWSLTDFKFLARLGDITAVILLVTSNKFSRQFMGLWWKRVQKLAYLYFYSGAMYEYLALQSDLALKAMILVSSLLSLSFLRNNCNNK